jgi:hypothetical protein
LIEYRTFAIQVIMQGYNADGKGDLTVNRRAPSVFDSLIASLPDPLRRLVGGAGLELFVALGIAAFGCVVLGCICSILGLLLLQPPAAPATPRPTMTTAPTLALLPAATFTPTINAANIGQYINPYLSANLQGMLVLQIDVRDTTTGNYVRTAQITGTQLAPFIESFNVSVKMTAPDPSCIDHLRLTITRADNSVVTFGACLKGTVILRGIPDLGGADAPMYPGFTDVLMPYLPDAYKQMLK